MLLLLTPADPSPRLTCALEVQCALGEWPMRYSQTPLSAKAVTEALRLELNNFTRLQPYKELITTKGHASMVATCCACEEFSQLVLARVEQQHV